MRVPVLSNDLPENFNKVAKYIGRHWPDKKLGLNKSRETLAFLFGYNSVHEVYKVAESTFHSEDVVMSDFYASMVGKALFKYGVRPDDLMSILKKTPFKELTFYKTTDDYRFKKMYEDQRAKGRLLIIDEYPALSNYVSPKIIIDQHHLGVIPPFNYAVKGNLIFSHDTYESLVSALGSVDKLVSELDSEISTQEFVNEYVLPLAWIPIEKYIIQENSPNPYWKLPHMLQVYHAKKDKEGSSLGYMIKHLGYNAFYPILCETIPDVFSALVMVYKKEVINASYMPESDIYLSPAYSAKLNDYQSWVKSSFKNEVIIDGQSYVSDRDFSNYSELKTNIILASKKWEVLKKRNIDNNLLSADLCDQHFAIKDSLYNIADQVLEYLNSLSSEDVRPLFSIAFDGKYFMLEDAMKLEGEDYQDIDSEDSDKWLSIGKEVSSYHPELTAFFDISALGYFFVDYESYVRNNRYVSYCEKRDLEFVAYMFSKSASFLNVRLKYADKIIVSLLLISHYAKKIEVINFEMINSHFNEISLMFTKYYEQDELIKLMEIWSVHQQNYSSKYTNHGSKSSCKEKSDVEALRDLSLIGRVYNKR